LENVDQIGNKMEQEVWLIVNKLRELKALIDTTFYDQLHLVMTFRKEKNARGLASLKEELKKVDEILRKYHQYKEDKNG